MFEPKSSDVPRESADAPVKYTVFDMPNGLTYVGSRVPEVRPSNVVTLVDVSVYPTADLHLVRGVSSSISAAFNGVNDSVHYNFSNLRELHLARLRQRAVMPIIYLNLETFVGRYELNVG